MGDSSKNLEAMRHSLAHITAAAVQKLWPDAKFGVGPVVDNGYYYDIDLGDIQISEDDFKKITKEMKKIISEDQTFEKLTMPIDEAINWAKETKQDYKLELLHDLQRDGTTSAKDIDKEQLGIGSESSKVDNVSFYKNGDFTDLCRGPHVESTGMVGAFKLTKVAGAYWRGDETKSQMQRLYGIAFETKEDLANFQKAQEEAKKRDHRKLGKELDLFTFSDLVGSGLPLFTPRGTVVKNLLSRLSTQLRSQIGFKEVSIPHITKQDLYETSGHWSKFGDELFLVKSQETSDQMALKPMNCPHHTQIYASKPRSYKDLPIMYQENTVQYRDEKSGELHGLSRVRSISIDDNHAFVRPDQIEGIAEKIITAAVELYEVIGMDLRFRLSFRDDAEGYLGDIENWEQAQDRLVQLAKANNLDYFIEEGEAAFYGPKIDFIVSDALGRDWQVATLQLDFVQPERFGLEYVDEDGQKQTPVMIHTALLGSAERFLSVYIEHTNGKFPFWLAPEQIRILTINDEVADYVDKITSILDSVALMKPLKYNELRYEVDNRSESLGKKIREARKQRVPMLFIVGPKDKDSDVVSVRVGENEEVVPLAELRSFVEKGHV
ncbi:TPA: threonine--tRNA ligase [Candidatus Saccharibacteria bacterium]|nr:threonine--tRNA ligase [Candidatus Saccharibacteria bacterium]HIO87695.1 threonine--tRNA ligase [Candidatus Saccharibacteria bacterium]